MSDEQKKVTADWDQKAEWMRTAGAVSAAWAPSGELLSVQLGPRPAAPNERDYPEMTDEQRATRELLEMERLMARTSGSLVRRVR